MTNLTSSAPVTRSRFDQSFLSDSPLPGHFTSTMRITPAGTFAMLRWPPVSSITVWPRSSNCCISGYTSGCSSGSPPVISTTSHSNAPTSATTWSTDIFRPSWNAYGVSHHEQRRSHAVRRTNTQGRPVCVDSPCIEWKISLTVSIVPANFYCTVSYDPSYRHLRLELPDRPRDVERHLLSTVRTTRQGFR